MYNIINKYYDCSVIMKSVKDVNDKTFACKQRDSVCFNITLLKNQEGELTDVTGIDIDVMIVYRIKYMVSKNEVTVLQDINSESGSLTLDRDKSILSIVPIDGLTSNIATIQFEVIIRDTDETIKSPTIHFKVNKSISEMVYDELENTIIEQYDKQVKQLIESVRTKVDKSDVYDKAEIDDLLDDKANSTDIISRDEILGFLADKADKDDVLDKNSTLNLLNTKADANLVAAALNDKANKAEVYTTTQVDTLLSVKVNTDDVDDMLELKADVDIVDGLVTDVTSISTTILEHTDSIEHLTNAADATTFIVTNLVTKALENEENIDILNTGLRDLTTSVEINSAEIDVNILKIGQLETDVETNTNMASSNLTSIRALRHDVDTIMNADGPVISMELGELKDIRTDSDGTDHGSANGRLIYEFATKASKSELNAVEGDLTELIETNTDAINNKVDISGGTMTGDLTVPSLVVKDTFRFTNDGGWGLIDVDAQHGFQIVNNIAGGGLILDITSLRPTAGFGFDLGSTTHRWGNVYATGLKLTGDMEIPNGKITNFTSDKATISNLTASGTVAIQRSMQASALQSVNKNVLQVSATSPWIYAGNTQNTFMIETLDGKAYVNNGQSEILTSSTAYNKSEVDGKVQALDDTVNGYIPMFAYMLDVMVRHSTGLEDVQQDFSEISKLLNEHVIERIKVLEERLGITPPSTNPEDKPQRPVINWEFEPYYAQDYTIRFETRDIPFGMADHYNLTKAGLRESSAAFNGVADTWFQNNWGYARTAICIWKTDIPGYSDNLSADVKRHLFNNWWVSHVDWIA